MSAWQTLSEILQSIRWADPHQLNRIRQRSDQTHSSAMRCSVRLQESSHRSPSDVARLCGDQFD